MTLQIAKYAIILNKHGIDSQEERDFLHENKSNKELIDLCKTSRWLKIELGDYQRNSNKNQISKVV